MTKFYMILILIITGSHEKYPETANTTAVRPHAEICFFGQQHTRIQTAISLKV
jgi:hypothetical protein